MQKCQVHCSIDGFGSGVGCHDFVVVVVVVVVVFYCCCVVVGVDTPRYYNSTIALLPDLT